MKLTDSEATIRAALERNSEYRQVVTTAHDYGHCAIEAGGVNFVLLRGDLLCDVTLSCVNDFQRINHRINDVKSFAAKVARIASADLQSYRDKTLQGPPLTPPERGEPR